MLAPITHALPPEGYGPWERVAFESVEGFVELGHEVTLFAPHGAKTSAQQFVPTAPRPLSQNDLDPRLTEELHIARAMEVATAERLDVIHSHLHVHALGYSRLVRFPVVSTLHGVAWNKAHHPFLEQYREAPFVSISDSERRFLPGLNYVATVYNGINLADFELTIEKDDYLLFAGRLAPEKAPDLAIEIARQSGHRLLLAGATEPRHQHFFEKEVESKLGDGIEYSGALQRSELADLLARAKAVLMPLRWDEPFGLVVVEALASGTPVIGWRRGAIPELVEDGRQGFLVADVAEAVLAVGKLGQIDPRMARARVEERFSRRAMAQGYVAVFSQLVGHA